MKNETINRILTSLFLIPLSFFFIIKGSFYFIFFISIFFLLTIYEWHMMTSKKKYYFPGLIFVFFSYYSIYLLRTDNDANSSLIFLFVFLICIGTDIGGYIFGKTFKGPKLTKISPNKTYSGMFGGFFLSIIIINIFINYSHLLGFNDIEFTFEGLVLVVLISFVSQVGDLIMSYFKRLSKLKNTGKIIPGHGGILDRIDGMIFAFPFSYIIFKFF